MVLDFEGQNYIFLTAFQAEPSLLPYLFFDSQNLIDILLLSSRI